MASFTLAELKARARVHADQEDSLFVSEAQLTGFLNKSLDALYDKVVGVWEDYFLTRTTATFTSTSYTLPVDFYKLVGLRVQGSNGRWQKLKKLIPEEEDAYLNTTNVDPELVRYRLESRRTLSLFPGFGTASVAARLSYIPLRPALVLDTDVEEWDASWEEWAVLDAAIKCMGKAEQDTTSLEKLRAAEEARIKDLAPSRDENDVARVADVTTGCGDHHNRTWWT